IYESGKLTVTIFISLILLKNHSLFVENIDAI
ncbi:unnamed protein product, partial [marine sediment metagenome]